jgi:hypothetical protein
MCRHFRSDAVWRGALFEVRRHGDDQKDVRNSISVSCLFPVTDGMFNIATFVTN